MKRKILFTIMSLLLLIAMATPAFATAEGGSGEILFCDPTYVIEEEPLMELNETLDEISARQKCEVCIFTTKDLQGKTATEFADDYYDNLGYGYGEDKSGILLLVDVEDRNWAISTCGFGIEAFTDAGQEYIMDQILPSMGEDDYLTAFKKYATLCDEFLTQAHKGEPYDNGNLPGQKNRNLLYSIIIGIIVGVGAAFVVVRIDKAALKTVRREAMARNYQRPGSLNIVTKTEMFMYKDVDKTARDQDSGSSTHTSSSGTTHGGSSGKF